MDEKYFKILDINPTNSIDIIKKAYIKQVFMWHPDRAKSNNLTDIKQLNIKTAKINEAFDYIKKNINFKTEFDKIISNVNIYRDPIFTKKTDDFVDDSETDQKNRREIKSSNIQWFEYYGELQILIVKFNNGAYLYENVPLSVYHELIIAKSKGKYLNKNISFSYPYHRLTKYSDWRNFAKKVYRNKY